MQIEIIIQNFEEYIQEKPPSLLMGSLGKHLQEDMEDTISSRQLDEQHNCDNGIDERHDHDDPYDLKLKAVDGFTDEFNGMNDAYVFPKITRKSSQESNEIDV